LEKGRRAGQGAKEWAAQETVIQEREERIM